MTPRMRRNNSRNVGSDVAIKPCAFASTESLMATSDPSDCQITPPRSNPDNPVLFAAGRTFFLSHEIGDGVIELGQRIKK